LILKIYFFSIDHCDSQINN